MRYSDGIPVRAWGGRLALDFVNTANWSAAGDVLDEKIETAEDLVLWRRALGLDRAQSGEDIPALLRFRRDLRQMLIGQGGLAPLNGFELAEFAGDGASAVDRQPLKALIAISALSILTDARERSRVKMCPGERCGWLFLDETKNARRTWCSMETCGNRAKAARHYARRKEARSGGG